MNQKDLNKSKDSWKGYQNGCMTKDIANIGQYCKKLTRKNL